MQRGALLGERFGYANIWRSSVISLRAGPGIAALEIERRFRTSDSMQPSETTEESDYGPR